MAERARRFLKPLLGTDVSLQRVEQETGVAWCPVRVSGGRVVDPFLSMRLHSMSDSALEEFLKNLESVVASMPEACVSMQARSDSAAVCAEMWNELREPLATWVSADEFASHVHTVCERVSSHYIAMAVAQLVEQLAGMRTLARVCCARVREESGATVVQQAVQDEAFMRTVTTPCAILKEEMKQARVPLEELSTCLEYESAVAVRGPAALAPCLAARQFGLMRWIEEHGSGASLALTACINRVRRLTDPVLDRVAWSGVSVRHLADAATQPGSVVMPLPEHTHLHAFERLTVVSTASAAASSAPLRSVRITSVVKQLVDGGALRPRTFSASVLLALLARVSAEARVQGATTLTCSSEHVAVVAPLASLAPVEEDCAMDEGGDDDDEAGTADDGGAHSDDDDETEEDTGDDFGEHSDEDDEETAGTAGVGVPASPLLHIQAVAAAVPGSMLVRMPPNSGAGGVPASLLREHAVFSSLASLLRDADQSGNDAARVPVQDICGRAALVGPAMGGSTVAVSQNTGVVLRKFVPYLHAYVGQLGQTLQENDLCYLTDRAWRGPGRCVSSTARGREWALLCLRGLLSRIESDPTFAREWHGNRKNKSKARRRALKATHAVAASTAAAALAE